MIPDEDPQPLLDTAKIDDEIEDGEDGVTGDGLGKEYPAPDDEDEAEDENYAQEMDDRNNSSMAKPTRRPLPKWLLEPFKARVAESSAPYHDATGLPPLYANHKMFWFPQPLMFFFLKQASTTPQHLFNPRFFLWDPDALCPRGIPCTNCWTVLQRHQVISQPCRCVDFDHTFWIISYQYHAETVSTPSLKRQPSLSAAGTSISWQFSLLLLLQSFLCT